MGLKQVHTGSAQEGAIRGEWFAGNHGPEGAWSSEKGTALEAPELSTYEQEANMGPDRLNQEVSSSNWKQYGPVESGTFDPNSLTRGTDKHMPK